MPIYCYRCDACGHVTELFRHAADRPAPRQRACPRCRAAAGRDYQAECGHSPRAEMGEIRSVAAGVMPDQAAAAEKQLTDRGIDGVRFDRRTGDAIFANRRAKLRAIAAMGLHDKDEIRG